jgi:REP element-mobilizing transposase RayT
MLNPRLSCPHNVNQEKVNNMSRFEKLTHVLLSIDLPTDGEGIREKRIENTHAFSLFLKQKPYWGNHFWAKRYCVDTVGVDADMIRKYVKYQGKREHQQVQINLTR